MSARVKVPSRVGVLLSTPSPFANVYTVVVGTLLPLTVKLSMFHKSSVPPVIWKYDAGRDKVPELNVPPFALIVAVEICELLASKNVIVLLVFCKSVQLNDIVVKVPTFDVN